MEEAPACPSPGPGDGGEVITPVGARSPGRRMGEYSYYASKNELIEWVNRILEMSLTRLDEFASGAVYCQILDAYYPGTVAMHKVNFHAREEYEFLSNYNQIHAAFNAKGIRRDINVQKLMRASPSEGLEFLQWLYKTLKKERHQKDYTARMRRSQSHKGGTDRIPTPSWVSGTFDVYGRVEAKSEFNSSYLGGDPTTPTQKPPRSLTTVSSRRSRSSVTRSKRPGSEDSRLSNISDSQEVGSVSTRVIDENEATTPRSITQVVDKSGRRSPSPVGIWAVTNENGGGGNTPPSRYLLPSEVAANGVNGTTNALGVLHISIPNFRSLLDDLGALNDSYAYRGKVRSMRDVMNTLIRHTNLLLDDLNGLRAQQSESRDSPLTKLAAAEKDLKRLEELFISLSRNLTQSEKRHPVPRSSTICITEKQKELSDTQDLDGALRRIGAAQAALAQALLKGSVEGSRAILNAVPASTGANGRENTANNDQQTSKNGSGPPDSITATETTSRTIRIGDYQIRRLKNGDIYKGRYVRSKKNGEGVYQFMNGDVYEGDFKDDRMGGYGLYNFSHEGRYEGQWANAVYEGVGTETFARGSTYHGEYGEGMRNGWGVCRYYNGDYYEGNWKHGLREGRGMQQCTDDSNYVGDYLAGKRHGHGVYSFPNGDRYLGEYERDIPHGYGVYMFASGQKYEGEWHSGKKHGWCIYTIETGEQWAGEWVEGKPKWVQGLTNGEDMDERWSSEICEKVNKAWAACRRAQQADKEGFSRADEHWATDGPIQRAIRDIVQRADEAAAKAQAARKRAIEVATKLDALAGEQQENKRISMT
ncbi:hypothetical protein BSKO_10883 [Bryopsis sp. KO-2023]|nr:hypothetical protein BSKO_10883 [Bryopsis sp. KO-2023]